MALCLLLENLSAAQIPMIINPKSSITDHMKQPGLVHGSNMQRKKCHNFLRLFGLICTTNNVAAPNRNKKIKRSQNKRTIQKWDYFQYRSATDWSIKPYRQWFPSVGLIYMNLYVFDWWKMENSKNNLPPRCVIIIAYCTHECSGGCILHKT